ncbi:NEL-type E3 ubiquitin ligase domain-containing protein [Pseudomonas sp. RIT623]|uniref:NEL-type E3 ubiquitin ligase domain-containing protein n=1 Tax=Pseudomonas sp. RIT623 TaxID=2559075 RepID=UPI001070007A|nr:NEL-type E3 ubiquitin ligase domain-containing protein [Pseudomonas sp. RIT623]TFF41607.1 hypothetical protein E3U47_09270 [Pseudomonas sp. RIT623]
MTPLAPDSIDRLIGDRLPAWLKNASEDRLKALQLAMTQQQRLQDQLQVHYGSVTPLDVFAEILLVNALQDLTGKVHDVRKGRLFRVWHKINAPVGPSLPLPRERVQASQSLLQAALHNFAASEESEEHWLAESRLHDGQGETLPVRPGAYAALCRSLNIGAKYQAYLEGHFRPDDAVQAQALQRLLEQVQQGNFEVAVRHAALKQIIDERTFLQLLPLISAEPIVAAYPVDVRPRQLYLLGKPVVGVVTLEIRKDRSRAARLEGVVAWLPGDPQAELARYPSWAALYEALGQRLGQPDYLAFFMRFISEADRPAFVRVLANLQPATGTSALPLDGRNQAIAGALFAHLRQTHIDKIIADARMLAVPTEDEDAATREARLQGYQSAGLDLLSLAALFVPGLGLAMAGIAVAQLVDEVYEGYQDWQLGDRESALGHLFNVAGMLGTGLVTAGVGKLLERVSFVDGLLPVLSDEGRLRLCDGSLRGYKIADEQGSLGSVMGPAGAQRIKLGQGSFLLEPLEPKGEWRIRHPHRSTAYGPLLRDNGDGGWAHEFEQAHGWAEKRLLLGRLGGSLAAVTEPEAEAVLGTTGFDTEQLRRLHVEGAQAPARLVDALERHRLHAAEPALKAEAFEQRIAAQQKPVGDPAQLLRRDFPGLSARSAEMLVASASGGQHAQLRLGKKVPLPLAEQARWALWDSRLDRACAGFYQAAAINSDCEKLMLHVADTLTPWREQVRIELREGRVEGLLLAQQGGEQAAEVRRILRTGEGYLAVDDNGHGVAGAAAGDSLAQALLLHMDSVQKLQLGHAEPTARQLTDACVRWLGGNRQAAAKLIGMVSPASGMRPPVRLGDGRLGYPLSGRQPGAGSSVRSGLRSVYPTLTDGQIEDLLTQIGNAGQSPWEYLAGLRQQLASLRQALQAWCQAAGSSLQRYRRRQVAKQIRRVWRRKLHDADGVFVLTLDGESLAGLPNLPASVRFDHVRRLTLRRMQLGNSVSDFIQRFGDLRHLDLGNNALTSIPTGIEHLTQLTHLRLAANQIVMDAAAGGRLSSLVRLRWLDLSDNPIGLAPSLQGANSLQAISLRNTRLSAVPMALLEHPTLETIDLRDNRITTVSELVIQLHRARLGRLVLHDNPLTADALRRLRSFSRQLSRPVHAGAEEAARAIWLQGLSPAEHVRCSQVWQHLVDADGENTADFFRFLRDLGRSEDYLNQPGHLRRRVWAILDSCEQNSEVREALFAQAAGPRTCSDQLLFILSELELTTLVVRNTAGLASDEAEARLLRLGRGLYRRDAVDRIAAEHISEVQASDPTQTVDDVEVYLAYRIGLAAPLGLPAQPEYMNYHYASGVTQADLRDARATVLAGENTQVLRRSLANRDFWQDFLRTRHGERFEAFDAPYRDRLATLEQQAKSSTEQEYLDQVEDLMAERNLAEGQLMDELTEQAYARHPD